MDEIKALRDRFLGYAGADWLISLADELSHTCSPASIGPDTTWSDVHAWLLDEYFPFYRRATVLRATDSMSPGTSAFEEWLLANYPELTRRDDCLAHTLIRALSAALAKGSVLLVVVDGLGGQWADTVAGALGRSGLAVEPVQLRLSVVPTLTDTAKTAMLRGQMPNQFEWVQSGATAYRDLLVRALGLTENRVHLATDRDSSLEELAEKEGDVYAFLSNGFDEGFVHKPLPPLVRWERVRRFVDELGEGATEAAQAIERRAGRPTTVVIVGDHGATEVSAAEGSAISVSEGCRVTHGRVLLAAPETLAEGTAYLDPGRFLLPDGVAVARGYRYFGDKPRGLTHGGITPQEVAVPFIFASTAEPRPVGDLIVSVLGTVARGRADNDIQVLVLNPNQEQARVTGLRLRLVRWVSETVFRLRPAEERRLAAYLDGSEVRSGEVELTGTLEWSHAGRTRTQEIRQVMCTTGAAVSDTRFEDMFGDA
jgi:hypothetical protein